MVCLDLPLVGRSAYDLLGTQPGVVLNGTNGVNINGSQTEAVNYTTDGINTQDNLLNGAFNTNVANTVSVVRVEEFRIVNSPADAEYGRGSGQVQMITRGGTNQFHGSAREELRNTDFNPDDWFNNAPGDYASAAGSAECSDPQSIRHALRWAGEAQQDFLQRHLGRRPSEPARGCESDRLHTERAPRAVPFFPGATNANAAAIVSTVDTSGNTVQPPTATGPLQTVSIFGRDPNRMGPDPTGTLAKYLGIAPLPNNYLVCHGLNAG